MGLSSKDWFRVENRDMSHPKAGDAEDKTMIKYNEHITVKDIPLEAYDYMVNGKPAIKWVMIKQRVETEKDSSITNDANDFANETMGDPAYPLRLLAKVITVSLETRNIVKQLEDIDVNEMKGIDDV